jgi:hypothetical protein
MEDGEMEGGGRKIEDRRNELDKTRRRILMGVGQTESVFEL